jgi:hypothetical protein
MTCPISLASCLAQTGPWPVFLRLAPIALASCRSCPVNLAVARGRSTEPSCPVYVAQAQLSGDLGQLAGDSPRWTRRSCPVTRRSCPWPLARATWSMVHCSDQVGPNPGVARVLAIVHCSMGQGSPAPIPGWHGPCLDPGPRFSAPRRGFAGFSPISHS